MDFDQLLVYVDKASTVLVLLVFVFGLYKRWWVMGQEYTRLEARMEKADAIMQATQEALTRSVETTARAVTSLRETKSS